MAKSEIIIEDLILLIDEQTAGMSSGSSAAQKRAYKRLLDLIGELETTGSPKRVKVSVKNVRIFAKIKTEISETLFDEQYKKQVDKYLSVYSEIDKVQEKYYQSLYSKFTPAKVLAEIQKQSIEQVREHLMGTGIKSEISDKVSTMILRTIREGGMQADLTEELREYLTAKQGGAMARYSNQVVNDSLRQYNRSYMKQATDDLGLEWFKYVGKLKDTSREFCRELIEAKASCMPYIHKSQFAEILRGHVCGKQLEINSKTGLPEGLFEHTTVDNFQDLAGGYMCGHDVIAVSSAVVPKHLRDQYER